MACPGLAGKLLRRGAGAQAVHDEVEQPGGAGLPAGVVDAPEGAHQEQDVVGVEAGLDAPGLVTGPQQQRDGPDDRGVGFSGDTELEAPYTPRADFQGVSDEAELARISAWLGIRPACS